MVGMTAHGCFLVIALLDSLIVFSANEIMERKSSTVVSRDRSGLVLNTKTLREFASALLETVTPFGSGLLSGAIEPAIKDAN